MRASSEWSGAIAALWACCSVVSAQDEQVQTWEGLQAQPLSENALDMEWVAELTTKGPYYTIWINELTLRYSAGGVSDFELLRTMRSEKPELMDAIERYSADGNLTRVTPKLLRDLVTAQGFGLIAVQDNGEPVFFDDSKFLDSQGEVLEGFERDHQAVVEANRIAKEAYLLYAAIRRGDESKDAAIPSGLEHDLCLTINPSIPHQITSDEVGRWSEVLSLSEQQQKYFESLYDQYLVVDREMRRATVDPIMAEWQEISSGHQIVTADEVAEDVAEIMTRARSVVARIIAIEEEMLLEKMRAVLADHQDPLLTVVRDRRLQHVYAQVGSCVPGCQINLAEVIESIADSVEAVWTDGNEGQATVREYERGLTHLLHQVHDARREWMGQVPLLTKQQRAELGNQQRLQDRIDNLVDRVFSSEEAVVEHHEMYLNVIAPLLQEDAREELRRRCYPVLYPAGIPNPYDLAETFEDIVASDALSEAQLEAVSDIAETNALRQRQLSLQIGRLAREREVDMHRRFSINWKERMAHADALDALHEERRDSADVAIQSVYGLFADDTPEEVDEAIAAFRAEAQEYRPRTTATRYYPAWKPDQTKAPQ